MKRLLPIIVLTLLLGCSGENQQKSRCVIDADCFAGEVCSGGVCADPEPAEDTGGGDTAITESDMSSPDMGGGDDSDGGETPPDATADAAADAAEPDQGPNDVCIVDPFTASCDRPDDNDSFSEYIEFEPRPPGCQDGPDELETGSRTLSNLQMCANETADKYSTNLIACDTVSFFLEVTVTPAQQCDPGNWSLDVSVQGNDCDEPGGRVECMTMPDGSKKVVAIVEPSRQLASASITIEKNFDDLQFDYDLDVVVRQ